VVRNHAESRRRAARPRRCTDLARPLLSLRDVQKGYALPQRTSERGLSMDSGGGYAAAAVVVALTFFVIIFI